MAIIAAVIATAVAFIAWLHRAHANLRAFHPGTLRYSRGWTIGGWFVPFLNLVRPYQVVREVWDVSRHVARKRGGEPIGSGTAVVVWWLLFIGSSVIDRVVSRLEQSAPKESTRSAHSVTRRSSVA